MASSSVTMEDLKRLMSVIQKKDEENEKHRKESQAQINELTKRMEDLETKRSEERTQFEREREQFQTTLRQVMANHKEEIKALTERYEHDRNAILTDLKNLRRENYHLNQRNGDLQRRIAELTRERNQRDNFIARQTTELNEKDEIMIAELASGILSGVIGLTSVFFGTLPITVILLGAAAALTVDGLRRWFCQPPHEHNN